MGSMESRVCQTFQTSKSFSRNHKIFYSSQLSIEEFSLQLFKMSAFFSQEQKVWLLQNFHLFNRNAAATAREYARIFNSVSPHPSTIIRLIIIRTNRFAIVATNNNRRMCKNPNPNLQKRMSRCIGS